jgi:hypothetical protein
MKTKLIASTIIMGVITMCRVDAQGFIHPVESLPSNECFITLMNGEEFKCKVVTGVLVGSSVRSLTVKDENGEKHRLKSDDIEKLRVKMSELARIGSISDGSESMQELAEMDFDEYINREWVFYEQALLPKKKNKYALLQLLNPGFDEKIKVYQDPGAQETMGVGVGDLQLTGGKDRSYLVVRDGQKSIKVKKGSYEKGFSELFSDCTKMLEVFTHGKKKIKFDDMAAHVLYYNNYCE